MNSVGQTYQEFRQRRPTDYQVVKRAVQNGDSLSQPVQRAAFGLPIVFFYGSLYHQYQQEGDDKRTARKKATGMLEGQDHDRRASPLWIRPVKLGDNSFAVVLVWFESQFLSPGERLNLKGPKGRQQGSVPDGTIIRKFVTESDPIKGKSLKDDGYSVIEVSYA